MDDFQNSKVYTCCNDTFNELSELESVIKLTKDVCQNHEFSSNYYNLPKDMKFILSEERNHYINMLSVALHRISRLKKINSLLEKELSYLQ